MKVYMYLSWNNKVVGYEATPALKEGQYDLVSLSNMKDLNKSRAQLDEVFSLTPEEAKIKWFLEKQRRHNKQIKSLEDDIKAYCDIMEDTKLAIGYDELKKEHPDLFV